MVTVNLRLIIIIVALLIYGVGWLVWTAWEQRQAKHESAPTTITPYLDVLTAAPIALFLLNETEITYSNRYGTSLLERLGVAEEKLLEALPRRTVGKSVVYKSLTLAAGTIGVWVGNVDAERRIVLLEQHKSAQKEQERLQAKIKELQRSCNHYKRLTKSLDRFVGAFFMSNHFTKLGFILVFDAGGWTCLIVFFFG